LNLKCDILVSTFTFKCSLYRYTAAAMSADIPKQMMWAGERPTSAASIQAAAVQVLPGIRQAELALFTTLFCSQNTN
jgi:hypothetical protein